MIMRAKRAKRKWGDGERCERMGDLGAIDMLQNWGSFRLEEELGRKLRS
jgi:hypothetical protein